VEEEHEEEKKRC